MLWRNDLNENIAAKRVLVKIQKQIVQIVSKREDIYLGYFYDNVRLWAIKEVKATVQADIEYNKKIGLKCR